MRRVVLGAVVVAAVFAGVFAGSARAGPHKDERWGFKLKVPSGWKQAAMSASEEWIAAKFLGKRALTAKKSDWYVSEHAKIWVIGFPAAKKEDKGAQVSVKGNIVSISFKNPYKDYKDFVKRENTFGGGYHFSKEKRVTIGDVEVDQYEIKIEKTSAAPFRVVAWVYHFEDIDFAIQCTVLEDHYKKHKAMFRGTLKSFKRIARKKAMPTSTTTGNRIITIEDEEKLTPEERAKRRREDFERTLRKELGALPKGWYEVRTKHYVALANADRKFTKRALNHAEAIRKYLDKTFPDIGSDYVPMGLMRVFASREEESAFNSGTSWMWGRGVEQVLVTQTVGGSDRAWEFEWLSSRLTGQYLQFKNSYLSDNMPYWFEEGLKQHMKFARSKGKSVTIKPDEYDRQNIKDIIKAGKAIPLKDMFEKGQSQEMTQYQAGSVCSYLLTAGNRGKTKGLIKAYLKNLVGAIDIAESEYKAESARIDAERAKQLEEAANQGATPTEESEDEEADEEEDEDANKSWEQRREALKKRREAILREAFEKTFGHLSEKDWKRIDKRWRDYAG